MKRLRRSGSEAEGLLQQDFRSTHDTRIAQEDFLGAAALLGLSHGSTQWQLSCEAQQGVHGSTAPQPAIKPEAAGVKAARHVSKASRTSYSTRSYVWRGPHRSALALKKKQSQHVPYPGQQQLYSSPSDGNSSRRSSASGAAPSDDEEVAQQQKEQQHQCDTVVEGPYASARQRDKEWAALTTWLRMNLHHPRTAKKLVLFVGEQDKESGSWKFMLNPGLIWEDVSIETKLRLKTLPLEAEQAFLHKYPDRPVSEWGSKVQKYKPVGSSTTLNVCLKDMVTSLNKIYFEHEPQDQPETTNNTGKAEQSEPAEEAQPAVQQHEVQGPQPEQQLPQQAQQHVKSQEQKQTQQLLQAPALGVPVGFMPGFTSAAAAAGPFPWGPIYPHWHQPWLQPAAAAALPARGMPAVGVPADVAAAAAAKAAVSCRQVEAKASEQQPAARLSQLMLLPTVAVAAGDGTDSCNESATPVAARTSVAFAAAC